MYVEICIENKVINIFQQYLWVLYIFPQTYLQISLILLYYFMGEIAL